MENNSKKEADSNVEAELNKSEDKNFEKSVEQKLKEAELNRSEDKKPEISVEQKLKETEDRLLRSLAELENQRRRFEKEIKDAFEFGGFNFAKEILAILDNLQRAKISISNDVSLKSNADFDKFIKNIDIIENDLTSIFEKNKIKKINSVNEKFDPNLHQAMLEIENENVDPGTIVQEIQPGYMYNERLLRPSFVGVAKKKTQKNKEKSEKKEE
jgi:molecular chaperone GrpE